MITSWFKRFPLAAGMLSYGGVWAASSVTQQKFISKHKVDLKAVARNTTVAVIFIAPMMHGWYRLVGLCLGTAARTWQVSAKITVTEQLIFGPAIISTFFVGSGIIGRDSPDYILNELRCKFPTTYLTSCCFFPVVVFFNHLFIPFHYKIIYQAAVSFIWSNFLCFVKEKPLFSSKSAASNKTGSI